MLVISNWHQAAQLALNCPKHHDDSKSLQMYERIAVHATKIATGQSAHGWRQLSDTQLRTGRDGFRLKLPGTCRSMLAENSIDTGSTCKLRLCPDSWGSWLDAAGSLRASNYNDNLLKTK